MIADPAFWVAAVVAVALTGLSKGGFVGAGALSLPLIALTVSPLQAAAILLPILIAQDWVGVWAFRRQWSGYVLKWFLPGAFAGIVLGYVFAASVSADAVLGLVGALSVVFGFYRLWIERRGVPDTTHGARWVGVVCGVASGFTSQIAHAGQPPFQLWVMPQRLSRDMLVGTTALVFAVINLAKVPAYVALGQFTRETLTAAALLMPVAIVSTLAGVRLVRRVAPERFYRAIYILMILVGAKLVWDALT